MNSCCSGVSIPPGATQFTRMLRFRYSSASTFVRWTTPAFDAQYAALYGWALMPAFDAMLTIAPPPSSRCGSAAWHTRNVPVRLTRDDALPVLERHLVRVGEAADAGAVHDELHAGRGPTPPPSTAAATDTGSETSAA